MKFIGRENELNKLNEEYKRDNSFVVIYGRRRIGKTTLIKEFLKDKTAFYYLATEELESQSMKRLAGVISHTTNNQYLKSVVFNDWLDLFNLIAQYRHNEKKVLVIDEFPYLVKTNPSFPSILQNAWDEILKDSNVMLIICGSFISMMQKYALSYESPLYGRRTSQMRLAPLSFLDIYNNQNFTFDEVVRRYSITGGVPKYLDFLFEKGSLIKQIEETIISKNGFLYEEPNFLLKSESISAVNYFSIIKSIADGNHKLGKIASSLSQDTPSIMPYLSTLIDLGFVEKRIPVTEKNPEKSRKGLYFISDNFIRFWFYYVYPYKGELELDNKQIVIDQINKDFLNKFVAFTYEDICKELFNSLCMKKAITFVPSKIGSYWLNDINEDTEIDVMAIDNQNKAIFVGECKYHVKPVDATVYFDLKEKIEKNSEIKKLYKDYIIFYGLFSKSGFTNRMLDIAKENKGLYLINEDKLVNV